MNYLDRLPRPSTNSINQGLSPCPTRFLVNKFGHPVDVYTDNCMPVTSKYWKSKMVTKSVGPFKVTGHVLAVGLFTKAFADVKRLKPDLYAKLGSAGMLCCRRVRKSKATPSNHALGMALDVLIDGKLDSQGDNTVYRGLLELYSVLKNHGIYWGAGFSTEDAMHFEVSAQTIMEWINRRLM